MTDLTFSTLENKLGLTCKVRPIQAKKLEIGEEEVEQKRLSGPGASQDERVGGVAVVEIEETRRMMIGLEDRQVFASQTARSTLRETCGSVVRFFQGCARALTGKGPPELYSGGKDRPFRMPPSLFNKVCLVGHW
jgi:hypothetical protein